MVECDVDITHPGAKSLNTVITWRILEQGFLLQINLKGKGLHERENTQTHRQMTLYVWMLHTVGTRTIEDFF